MTQGVRFSTLSIVGTAGAGPGGAGLTRDHYDRMMLVVMKVMRTFGAERVVGGGSPWAGHLAVRLAIDRVVPAARLTLRLPCGFELGLFDAGTPAGRIANAGHRAFAAATAIDSLGEVDDAIDRGCEVETLPDLRARNDALGACDGLLAFCRGPGTPWVPRIGGDGATSDDLGLVGGAVRRTWDASDARVRVHVPVP